MRTHLKSAHSVTILEQQHSFRDDAAFRTWLDGIEAQQCIRFVAARGAKALDASVVQRLYCSHDATVQHASSERLLRPNRTKPSQPRKYRCTAFIQTEVSDGGRVSVRCVTEHCHPLDRLTNLRFCNLSDADTKLAAALLALHVEPDWILLMLRDDVHHRWAGSTACGSCIFSFRSVRSLFDQSVQRRHFATRQDLRNIRQRTVTAQRDPDDTLSTHQLLGELANEPGSPVLYYKAPGVPDAAGYGIPREELFLVLATPFQLERLADLVRLLVW
jgi:hypothetical protein